MPSHFASESRVTAALLLGVLPWLGSGCRQAPPALPEPVDAREEPAHTPSPVENAHPQGFRGTSRSGTYEISWRPVDGTIPLNELFELEVHLTDLGRGGTPVTGAEVVVQASMPEHNHGMLREPRAREVEAGVYRVEGMLLHMTGYWKVFIDVIRDGVAETAEFELTLE